MRAFVSAAFARAARFRFHTTPEIAPIDDVERDIDYRELGPRLAAVERRLAALERALAEVVAALRRDAERQTLAAERVARAVAAGADVADPSPLARDLYGSTLDVGYADLVLEGAMLAVVELPGQKFDGTTEELQPLVERALVAAGRSTPGAPVFRSTKHLGRRLGMVADRLRAEGFEVAAFRDSNRRRHWRIAAPGAGAVADGSGSDPAPEARP